MWFKISFRCVSLYYEGGGKLPEAHSNSYDNAMSKKENDRQTNNNTQNTTQKTKD